MKWVKFERDFKTGGTFERLGYGATLIQNPVPSVIPHEPPNYVSRAPNPYIDDCFRIYQNQAAFDTIIQPSSSYRAGTGFYHPWVCHNHLPKQYFDETYFDPAYYDSQPKNKKQGLTSTVHYSKVRPHPYEIFIGGWLYFWDSEVQFGNTDHAVYFDWDFACDSVTVYILELKMISRWNVYIQINPPGSADPPPPKGPPPPTC